MKAPTRRGAAGTAKPRAGQRAAISMGPNPARPPPFVSSFAPSERAKAAGAAVEVDISALKPGEKITVEWRGKPVWIVRARPSSWNR
jgi:Rieske Fe-S protein